MMPDKSWLFDKEGYVFRDDKTGTTVFLPGDYVSKEERMSNARLATAAPNLLKACKEFILAWEKSEQLEKTNVALSLAKAAVTQAEEAQPWNSNTN